MRQQSANHSPSLRWELKTAPWEFQTKLLNNHDFFLSNNKRNLHFTVRKFMSSLRKISYPRPIGLMYVWLATFMCVTWLVHMCAMTLSNVWHDSFICIILQNDSRSVRHGSTELFMTPVLGHFNVFSTATRSTWSGARKSGNPSRKEPKKYSNTDFLTSTQTRTLKIRSTKKNTWLKK